jgi:hypothetical protein
MFPTVGQIVIYTLTQSDAEIITRRRTSADSVKNRLSRNPPEWPEGAQAHVGDPVAAGDQVPLVVTRANPPSVNGQAFLNGNDTLWLTGVEVVSDQIPTPGQAIALADQFGLEATEGAGRKSRARQ